MYELSSIPPISSQPRSRAHGDRDSNRPMPVYQPNVTSGRGNFQSEICQCLDDEESCWIGTWCCCLLSARTAGQFMIYNSLYYTSFVFGFLVLCFLLSIIGAGGLAFLLLFFACCAFPCIQASTRSQIRAKLGIHGNFIEDYMRHCCLCTMSCTLCQEAREAKAAGLEMIDLCSGEKLPDLSLRAPSNTLIDGSSVHSQSGTENALSSLPTMQYISKTSYIIITASTMIVLITTMTLLGAGRIGPLLILILAFLQPVVVLYYIYYKDHRHSIPLDSVIKIFAIGFFLTTFQSAIIEEVLQSVFILVFAPMLPQAISTSNDDVNDKNISGSHDNHHPLSSMGINFVTSGSSSLFYSHHDQMDSDNHGISYTGVKNPLSVGLYNTVMYCVSFIQDAMSTSNTFAYDTHPYTAFSYSSSLEADIATSGSAASIGEESENNGDLKSNMATHMFLFIVIFAVLAFVIAAGVEETMKQFIVRCHHFGTPLKDPYTIMVYLMTGALGFTVMENISYVFNSQHSPVPGTSLFVGELMVLLLRVCLPVHLICSVLQSVNLSKIVMGQEINMSLFIMLLPAILLHGSFDFILFFMSFLGFVYNLDTIWYECITFVIAASIAGGGAYVAWDRWKRVTHDFEYGFSQIDATSTHSMGDSGDRSGNPMHSSQV